MYLSLPFTPVPGAPRTAIPKAVRKYRYMLSRLAAAMFAVCLVASGQTLTVEKLVTFIKNQQQFVNEKKSSDQETARYLAKVKLTEKLDDRVIEDLQALGIGKETFKALEKLKEQSQGLTAAVLKPVLPDEPIPVPTSLEQGAVLDEVRDYVVNYDNSLPDFICIEVEGRQAAARPGTRYGGRAGGDPSFQNLDTITSRLTYFNHKEEKTPLLHNSTPTMEKYENLGGSTSTGDFATMLRTLFERSTEAHFEWDHWATLRRHLTMVFAFHVEQARSKWGIQEKDTKQEIVPAYSGKLYVDNESHKVTRLIQVAEGIPPGFPIKRAQETLDYDYTDIGGQKFLLPLYGEVQMDGSEFLSRNSLQFEHYRKYEASSAISYDVTDTPDPISPDKLKETPATKPTIDCKDPKNKNAPECRK
jgi:hypothetical protein